MSFVGQPYRWAGSNPILGWDCSGLVQEILKSAGIDPVGDQTAQALYDILSKNSTHGSVGPGSVVFYGKSVKEITHVAFCVDQYRMIEAGGGDSKVTTVSQASDRNAFVRIRLINNRKDLVASLKPNYVTIGMIR